MLAAARAAVLLMHEEEEETRASLWTDLGTLLRQALDQCDGEEGLEQAKGMLLAAVMVRSSTQFGRALQRATSLGPWWMTLLQGSLHKVVAQEEHEGLWRCLASSLAEEDHVAVSLWLEEAKSKGLEVPLEVHGYRQAADEAASRDGVSVLASELADEVHDFDFQELFEACVMVAHMNQNVEELHRLAAEAAQVGADPSMAHAALLQLEELRAATAPPWLGRSLPSRPSSLRREGAASNGAAAPIGAWSTRAMKTELASIGVDLRGVCEKGELVQLLRTSRDRGRLRRPTPPDHGARRHVHTPDFSSAVGGSSADPLGGPPRPFGADRGHRPPEAFGGAAGTRGPAAQRGDWSEARPRSREARPRSPWAEAGDPPPFAAEWAAAGGPTWAPRRARTVPPDQWPPRPGRGGADESGNGQATRGTAEGARGASADSGAGAAGAARGGHRGSAPRARAGAAEDARRKALECLGLGGASAPSAEELQRAYRQAALQWHPDRPHNHDCREEATRRFQEARAALELLRG